MNTFSLRNTYYYMLVNILYLLQLGLLSAYIIKKLYFGRLVTITIECLCLVPIISAIENCYFLRAYIIYQRHLRD